MIFDLKVINHNNGRIEIWKFDNVDCNVIDAKGREQFPKTKFSKPTLKLFKHDDNDYHFSKKLRKIKISLGVNCNMNCSYCFQTKMRKEKDFYRAKKSDIDNFVNLFKVNEIFPETIAFWGGEPFVYWKILKPLVEKLRTLYPLNSKTKFIVISNGTLLNDEIVDFCIKYRLQVRLSHDGENNTSRTDADILKEKEKYIKKLVENKCLKFLPLIHHGNTNVIRIYDFFSNTYQKNNIFMKNVARCENADDENQVAMTKMDEKDFKELERTSFLLAQRDEWDKGCGAEHFREAFEIKIKNRYNIFNVIGECYTGIGEEFAVNLNGDIFICQNKIRPFQSLGNLKDYDKIKIKGIYHWTERENCKNCPFVAVCMGGCAGNDERAHALSCPNKYHTYIGSFKSAMLKLFNISVLEISANEK